MGCWFILAESNTNSESLFMLLLLAILSYYLSSLYKHMFYLQARVEQSVLFHHLSSFSSYYGARPKNKSYRITRRFANQCPQLGTSGTSRTNPSPSCPGCPGPRPNLDSKPPLLSPGLSVVQGPPPSPSPISRSGKCWNQWQESNEPSCSHKQACAQDNKSVTWLESTIMDGP